MTKTLGISTRSKFFILLFLLWTAPAFGGSPDASQSPECKAAVKQVDSVESDVDAAFEALGQAMEKTDRALEEERRVMEGYRKALDSKAKRPPGGWLNRVNASFKHAYGEESSARTRLKQVMQRYDRLVETAIAQCGGSR